MLVFDDSRQSAFASLSGDYNPLHVDVNQGRRSQFGGCVVHGVHLILAALDSLRQTGPYTVVRIDAQFRSAVMVGETVTFTHEAINEREWRIAVKVGNQVRSTILLELSELSSIGTVANRSQWTTNLTICPSLDELADFAGTDHLGLDISTYSALFPGLSQTLKRSDAASLLGVTRIVGMQCPGQWALFRRLTWDCVPGNIAEEEAINYRVSRIDRRFAMVTLALEDRNHTITAEVILRAPPPAQIDIDVARLHVGPSDFDGVRALIVGGSRGLGELTAKLLVAGGAKVLITYRTGAGDASRLVSDLGCSAQMIQYSVDSPNQRVMNQIIDFSPTNVSYFATPVITKRPPNSWNSLTFEKFINVYAIGLSRLLETLQSSGTLKSLFYPSSTFLNDTPAGFSEYIAAKLAGEAICQAWQRTYPEQRILIERLPPLVTDQTSARLGSNTFGNIDILLPILHKIIGHPQNTS